MHELVEDGSQFVVATHSPILVAYPGAKILECSEAGVRQIGYDQVPQVELYRAFLDEPGRYLHHLLGPDERDE